MGKQGEAKALGKENAAVRRLRDALSLEVGAAVVAQASGMSPEQVEQVINGKRKLTLGAGRRLLAELRIHPEWWDSGAGSMFTDNGGRALSMVEAERFRLKIVGMLAEVKELSVALNDWLAALPVMERCRAVTILADFINNQVRIGRRGDTSISMGVDLPVSGLVVTDGPLGAMDEAPAATAEGPGPSDTEFVLDPPSGGGNTELGGQTKKSFPEDQLGLPWGGATG